jgi:two-component system NtrC family response regulator/two-component system nitrogen regulation response regulator GlnG
MNRDLIVQALERCGGNRAQAAKLLGMSRPTMIYRIEKYGIKV